MTTAGTTLTDIAQTRHPLSMIGSLAKWNAARLTRRDLRRMSRHELGDIGIDDLEALIR